MSWSDGPARRGVLLGLVTALAGCGLSPVLAPGGSGGLRGRVAVTAPDDSIGYALRTAIEDRLGLGDGADLTLSIDPQVDVRPAAITEEGARTRFNLLGRAPFRLTDATGVTLSEGVAEAFAGYSATGTTVATRAAEADAEQRLAASLAEIILTRLSVVDLPAQAG